VGVWAEGWAWVGLEAAVVAGGGGDPGRVVGLVSPAIAAMGLELDSQVDCVNQTQIVPLLLEGALFERGSG
jgi:hypothetical protein